MLVSEREELDKRIELLARNFRQVLQEIVGFVNNAEDTADEAKKLAEGKETPAPA